MCQAGVELHLGHGGNQCPADTVTSEDPETEDEIEAPPGGIEFDDEDDGWECDNDRPKRRNRDSEYGNGLPALKGKNVVVFVDTSGVHRLRVHYCQCPNARPADRQFVEMGFLPASVANPKTVFTFGVLDDFRLTNLECNTAGTSYWHKLARKTSNVFPGSVPVCSTSGHSSTITHECRIATGNCYDASAYGDK